MDKKRAAQGPTSCPDIEMLARVLYEQAASEGLVPPINETKVGRPPNDWKIEAWAAAYARAVSLEEAADLLEQAFPGQPGEWSHKKITTEARRKRVVRYIKRDAEREARMLRPDASDEVLRMPEERLARLKRLLDHHVNLALGQWLRAEKILDD